MFSIVKRSSVSDLLRHINRCDPQIVFTLEREDNGCLPFLDVAVRRGEGRRLRTSVFRKETHTDHVLNFNSHHSRNAKLAVVRSLMNRLDSHFAPDDMEGKQLEYEHIVEVLRANDYPERFIHQVREEPHTQRKVPDSASEASGDARQICA